MLTARERLQRRKERPALVELHRALSRLTSTLTVMNTGAHPDDEESGMLAAFRFAFGMRVIVACSTRGEGGQNRLGLERAGALGVLRTREMEEAARTLDGDIVWLGHGPDDPVHDFGFSKNGKDTLSRWGRERIVERLVRAYRAERPDIVIPTFLDVPGQHGHHRAMTEAAEEAVKRAADPNAYPEHLAEGLTPWQVGKYYLPAWSGGGGTYDDEVPPPGATVTVSAPGVDMATGAAYDEIGEWSRACHASQGMGEWRPEPQSTWSLHLKRGGKGTETDIRDHLPATLTDLAAGLGRETGAELRAARARIDEALEAFPRQAGIIPALAAAARHIETAQARLSEEEKERIGHRLARKLAEIDAALAVAAGITATVWAEPAALTPGGCGTLHVHLTPTEVPSAVDITPVLPDHISSGTPARQGPVTCFPLKVSPDAPVANAYPPAFSSLLGGGTARVALTAEIGGRNIKIFMDPEQPLDIVPAHSLVLSPDALVVSTHAAPERATIRARVEGVEAWLDLASLPGIAATPTADGLEIDIAPNLGPGRYTLPATVNGAQAWRQTPITYPHIGRTRFIAPQNLDVLALDLRLPEGARIGYVGGGADRVGLWLKRMGLDVTDLDEAALRGDLGRFTTIVVGIFAFGLRPDLAAATRRLHEWVEGGGHLVTLYHRPRDGWLPDRTPPRRLVIGTPSLRWRVTQPASPVAFLAPDHSLLQGPNTIDAEDFAGWDKERGLYFASEWDGAYTPLLAMHDAGEAPLKGSLLTARVDDGQHTHTSLALHHQLDKLVPGAFRLMANLVQPVISPR
ncbi:PIG-L family deacetylase [Chelativorans salis]|uniref:PIG-L family deacetylase n=1 Tax=Chelativorans salis TaxID=2978478 RepID=A0ABT2LLR1_9HYPH|nr:PIG-L family deacetylase [Chelativorans sp. EGI FJ00035]MCT7374313.1 PIG-L family deacetylase [Chelativorans sp. EGI FJ00035]